MKYKGTISLIVLLTGQVLAHNNANRQEHNFDDKDIKCTYETYQGRMDGKFVSYYQNGHKKAEGQFADNGRVGLWTMWEDSSAAVILQREYTDPFNFNSLLPKAPHGKRINQLSTTSLLYNKEGFIEYFKFKEKSVVWSKRIWRLILPKENSLLFEKDRMFTIIHENLRNKNIAAYQDDGLQTKFIGEADTADIKVIGYRTKEDWFFDRDRLIMETRTIAICPVITRTTKMDTLDLYWIYLPAIRKYLAKEKIHSPEIPPSVKTIDDIFFYRYFHGKIYKEANVYDRPVSAYPLDKEAKESAPEKIHARLIDAEHDLWIYLLRQKHRK